MTVDLRPIIADLVERAADFLAGVSDRKLARAGVEEEITLDYPTLNPSHRAAIVSSVMAMLEEDDFFGTEFVGDVFSDTDSTDDD